MNVVNIVLVAMVLSGATVLVVGCYQFFLAGLHIWRRPYIRVSELYPRVAVIIPAWNEAAVIGTSVDRLMQLDYPPAALRVVVVDDASTDATPEVIAAKAAAYPGRVIPLRRDRGGEGKAATLNHGLAHILADDWAQAIMIIDADVIYEPTALRRMTRHLADPAVGSVTAYIKEGSRPGSYLTRFIGYEYIVASAAARRSQEVLGAIACLAGGAQLHSRENLEAIGGRVDTGTLAEDTVTTFQTQLGGRRAVFEPHAVVWSEEPGSIGALWRQRLRWARGNLQVTRRFKGVWFRPQAGSRLGGITFGLIWFCLLLLPALMVCASASLVTLFFINRHLAYTAFHVLWLVNVVTYVFITSFALLIDPQMARRTWKQALLFPGVVNVVILLAAILPGPLSLLARTLLSAVGVPVSSGLIGGVQLFTYIWVTACMGVAYLGKVAESRRLGWLTGPLFVYVGGYGPLLCAVTAAAYLKELRHAEARWEKTEKTGKVVAAT